MTDTALTKTTLHLPADLVLAAKERALKESRGGIRVTLRDIAQKALVAYLRTPVNKSRPKG
jgi:hypothetical protein